jgi:AcrR family transcriptional regulator
MGLKTVAVNPRNLLVREELLSKAAEVFERHGFAQTRIQDIAAAMALSRSALYHYFSSKEDILTALVEEHTSRRAEDAERVALDTSKSAVERLKTALHDTIIMRLTGGARLRVLDHLAIEMPPDLRKKFDRSRRQILNGYVRIITDGVKSGEFRAVEPRIAALAVLGIASWTSWWYSTKGDLRPEELADILVDIGVSGLLRHTDERAAGDRAGILNEIRIRLNRLESL